jgi:hypothetical protein
MFISPYSTTPCTGYHTSIIRISNQIETNYKSNDNSVVDGFKDEHNRDYIALPGNIAVVTSRAENVQPFGHPVYPRIIEKGESGFLRSTNHWKAEDRIYIDGRPFTSLDRVTREVKLSNRDEFEISAIRAGLMWYTLKNSMGDLLSCGNFALTVWTRWLSDLISRKVGLSIQDHLRVSVIVAAYYYCLFDSNLVVGDNVAQFSERDKIKMATGIAKATRIEATQALQILDTLPVMLDADTFTKTLATHGGSIRLDGFNTATLWQSVGGSWFGLNSRELVCVALEHPPTYFAILFKALRSRSYQKTILGQCAENNNKKGEGDAWVKALLSLPEAMPISYNY